MSLADVEKGKKVVIASINGASVLKKRLNSLGVVKNKEIEVSAISLGNSNIKISIDNTSVALRFNEAKQIKVKHT